MFLWSSCADEFCKKGSIIESVVINCQLYLGLHFLQHGSERYEEENPALFNLESGRNLICLNHISPRERTVTTLWTTEFNFQKKKCIYSVEKEIDLKNITRYGCWSLKYSLKFSSKFIYQLCLFKSLGSIIIL